VAELILDGSYSTPGQKT